MGNSAGATLGNLFIVSAPSGTGKTTLSRMLLANFPGMLYSISHTTRQPRQGEKNGLDYFFVSRGFFEEKIETDAWVEWAMVHDNYYGTSAEFIDKTLGNGMDVLLDIDVQGAMQIIKRYPDSITIFIMPPSMEELKSRLVGRGTDSPESIETRLKNALQEIEDKEKYRYIVVNDNLETALGELKKIIATHKEK